LIFEVAELRIRPGEQSAFEQAMTHALHTITAKAKGVTAYSFLRSSESPQRYILQVTWERLEDHMVAYRESPEREQWRALVSPFFAEPPTMEHFSIVAQS
jgi:quinol monooxygenase YgiN